MTEKKPGIHFYIIVVSYNPGDRLRRTLESICSQDYWDYDVIIEDSESTDGSLSGLKEEGFFDEARRQERIHIHVEKDKGIYDGMNRALDRMRDMQEGTSHEDGGLSYVIFLNCGDAFHDRQVLGMIADSVTEEAYAAPYIYYGDQYNMLTSSVVSSNRKLNEFALFRNVPCHQVCFYDRRLFAVRGYDISYRVRADYEHFLYCIYEAGAKTQYVDCIVSDYEGGGYSESEEGREISAAEHRRITDRYMGSRAGRYRLRLILTGAGIRTRLAESRRFSGAYNRIKSLIYRR